MGSYNFLADRKAGGDGERFVGTLLATAGLSVSPNESPTREGKKGWDLRASHAGRPFTVEVKSDLMESKTGNVAVEYFNTRKGEPAGILATTADLWAYVLKNPQTAWVCKTSDLRRHFDTIPCLRDVPCGGDGNAAMKLYRREDLFAAVFHRVDLLTPRGLSDLLGKLLCAPCTPADPG